MPGITEQSSGAFVGRGKEAGGKITLSALKNHLTYLQPRNRRPWRAMSVSRGQISSRKHACGSASPQRTRRPSAGQLARTRVTEHGNRIFKLTHYTRRLCLPGSEPYLGDWGGRRPFSSAPSEAQGIFKTKLGARIPKVQREVWRQRQTQLA